MKKVLVLAALPVAAVLLACAAPQPDTQTPEPADPTTVSAAPSVAPTRRAVKPTGIQDGQWQVGAEVAPGRYKTAGPDGDYMCYWEITTTPNAKPGTPEFVTNDVPPGQAYVTLKKGQYFKTSHCQTWILTS